MILTNTYAVPAKGPVTLCKRWGDRQGDRVERIASVNGTELPKPKGKSKWTYSPPKIARTLGKIMLQVHIAPGAESLAALFEECDDLLAVEGSGKCRAVDFRETFYHCHNLKSVTGIDTHRGRNFRAMFIGCRSLELVGRMNLRMGSDTDKDGLSISPPGSIDFMFAWCESLTAIPEMDWPHVVSPRDPFAHCPGIFPDMKRRWLNERRRLGWR